MTTKANDMKKLKLFFNTIVLLSAVACLVVAVQERLSLGAAIASNNAFQSALLLIIIGLMVDKYFSTPR